MGRISVAIDIDAPPDEVWCVIEPLEDHPDWMHDAVSVRFATDQTRGIGTRTIVGTKVGPFRLTDHMTVTEWEPGTAMGVEHTGVVTGTGRFTLRPIEPGRTAFSWNEELRYPWWLGGRLGALVGDRLLAAIWRRNLRDLKALVEDGPRQGS